ncbi:MAG: DUF2309 domain-containing protein [Salinarchaeum sp.]
MSPDPAIREHIEAAAESIGPVWPLHSFVTANPLAGFEDRPFHAAVQAGEATFSGQGYPTAATFERALADGQIDRELLESTLHEHGYTATPETLLAELPDPANTAQTSETPADRVDQVLTKWLAAFLDQGKAHWPMPDREAGFYHAVRTVAPHDGAIPDADQLIALSADPLTAIETLLADVPESAWSEVFEHQLAALPGWSGFIIDRIDAADAWHQQYPITLAGYLAVRLALTEMFSAPMVLDNQPEIDDERPLADLWLSAWEATYRRELLDAVTETSATHDLAADTSRPEAQLVFCIDTRSERIRRHIEAAGDYETYGYAGFFGIPMRYQGYDASITSDACPPMNDVERRVVDRPDEIHTAEQAEYDRWHALREVSNDVFEALKANAATAFNFVETAGPGYGLAMAARTLVPQRVYEVDAAVDKHVPDEDTFCTPSVEYQPAEDYALPEGFTHEERVAYAAAAFERMGFDQFARVVVFAGHSSQTTNNPFDSSLDCGACAGNPGGPNARALATICNDPAVKASLRDRGIAVPDNTVFVAGEHATTTSHVELFTTDVPETHANDIDQLEAALATARTNAAAERAADMGADDRDGRHDVERRATDWAEPRPEWGLAGNAGFIVGPRALTKDLDLDERVFLHAYDWQQDVGGEALEAILTGPMVVTQWINTQYYFASVDNAVYGSGSKITHNPVGNIGVYQGNGGDLMAGLPLQSLFRTDDELYHQPLRLSTIVHAPVDRVTDVLAANEKLVTLLDNDWLSLTVIDPEQDHQAFHYDEALAWHPAEVAPPETTVADE